MRVRPINKDASECGHQMRRGWQTRRGGMSLHLQRSKSGTVSTKLYIQTLMCLGRKEVGKEVQKLVFVYKRICPGNFCNSPTLNQIIVFRQVVQFVVSNSMSLIFFYFYLICWQASFYFAFPVQAQSLCDKLKSIEKKRADRSGI